VICHLKDKIKPAKGLNMKAIIQFLGVGLFLNNIYLKLNQKNIKNENFKYTLSINLEIIGN